MSAEFSPGIPMSIEPGRAPFGVVLRVVLDTGEIIVEQTASALAPDALLEELADAGARLTEQALADRPEATEMTVCGYDGDDGRLMMTAVFGRDDVPG